MGWREGERIICADYADNGGRRRHILVPRYASDEAESDKQFLKEEGRGVEIVAPSPR